MKKVKKIVSFLTAAAMAVTVNFSVAAEATAEPELTDIHGYMCYERDGEYWTVLDNVEYLVLDLDTFDSVESEKNISDSGFPMGKPTGWDNDEVINLTASDPSYEDFCDLSSGNNYYSPVYNIDISASRYSAEISTKVFFTNTYDIKIYTYQGVGLGWIAEKHTLKFSTLFGTPCHVLFTASASKIITGLALEFLSSSTGQKDLYYTITINNITD